MALIAAMVTSIRAGQSGKVGSGTLTTYRMEVEGGLPWSADEVAAIVDKTLGDKRGWISAGHSLQRTQSDAPHQGPLSQAERVTMCFSATASFTAGTALIAVGVMTLHKSRGLPELPLALVPLLFGLQQLTEGVLWPSFRHDLPLVTTWATYTYSFFSHMLWPIFAPLAILLVETKRRRRTALEVFQVLGLAVGLYLLYFILRFPVSARVHNRSVVYDSPHFFLLSVMVVYLLATCVSGLFSGHRCINVFGVLAFVLAVAAYQVSALTLVSVWCFFAAVLSLVMYVHFSGPMQACRPALDQSPNGTWKASEGIAR